MGRTTAARRVNLSVEPELKDRMDAVKRSNAVNWSAVVHPLLEAQVAMLERSRGDQTAAVQRLLALKLQAERQQLISGRIDGRDWGRTESPTMRLSKGSRETAPATRVLGIGRGSSCDVPLIPRASSQTRM
jgi:hypothetical protein